MDKLIDLFFKQCETGRVQIDDFFYNIHFTINHSLNDNVPVITVKNKELFYSYIKQFISLFNLSQEEDILKKLVYLFSNLSFSDFNNIESYVKRNIDFVQNRLFENKNIPFLYRNHELKNFYREELEQFKMVLKKEKNTRAYLNEIEILKSRYPKSYYDIVNRGHAGLHITAYSHITSPIRRVADDYNMLSIMKWLANDTSDMEWYKHELLLKEIADYINHQQKALDTFSFRYFLQKINKPR